MLTVMLSSLQLPHSGFDLSQALRLRMQIAHLVRLK